MNKPRQVLVNRKIQLSPLTTAVNEETGELRSIYKHKNKSRCLFDFPTDIEPEAIHNHTINVRLRWEYPSYIDEPDHKGKRHLVIQINGIDDTQKFPRNAIPITQIMRKVPRPNARGRRAIGKKRMQRYSVTLTEELVQVASTLGEGNISAGIRKALKQVKKR